MSNDWADAAPGGTGAHRGAAERDWRADQLRFLRAIAEVGDAALPALFASGVRGDAVWHPFAPLGALTGPDAVMAGLLTPLRAALPGHMRRDDILMGGRSRVSPGHWIAALGHYVGNFERPLFGVPPSGKLAFLRFGEFYRIEAGKIAEARLIWDLLDLARQAGIAPPQQLGIEMLFPAPATHDGVVPGSPERSDASAELVEAMLTDLRAYDPATFDSTGQTGKGGYWHQKMLWYGPAGIGSNVTYAGFQRDHRVPFLTAFPDRVGGNHYARFGDGDYVCSSGWPSMTMTHRGPYLGVAPTGLPLTLRVMDFWRCEGGSIRENWVLLDFVDLLTQLSAPPAWLG